MKAVIPAGGLGTRFLPVTKAQPKEMLPVVDKPAIQYVMEEVQASGITDVLIITGRGKRAIEDHFDRSIELEVFLEERDNNSNLKQLHELCRLLDIHYIRQGECKGLGHAIYCARQHVGNEPFAVLLGDTITLDDIPCTQRLLEVFEDINASVIAVERVPEDKVENYGIIRGKSLGDGMFLIEDLIEKPSRYEAPSDLAVFGRYILTPQIFEHLERTPFGRNNEIQLTDGLRSLLRSQPIYAYEIKGRRYDIGNKLDWIKATIELALEREDLGQALYGYLEQKMTARFKAEVVKDYSVLQGEGLFQASDDTERKDQLLK